ncbi:uncharacterized protein FFB20_13881 [Fusarium fujikuroi]|uniref:Uncharacterized protein n=1 Tax=Fusarium fujikuroi TaxID=5127 RepID=A0A2H3RUU5_FUSFU|nr:uncharacterized protein Y057_8175 [Fusarium fujikuroi]QGI85923.1 hypothetical protein CEK25_012652 [Fusarium fujikuroi]QGI99621.1 hypothetical protein CEK26_012690 [Fusarium fujikuroi]SCN99686.1 uncharacterized protein FFC1_08242 [Fusarium fujikuroi]SCO11754.1 uncharacterized protein FFB20_13881 [Fusarium fujikuroi]
MKSTVTLLAITAAVHASPLQRRQDENTHVWDNVETFCNNQAVLLRDAAGAASVWENTTAGNELDIFIAQSWEHELNWLLNLEDNVVGGVSGGPTVGGCGTTEGECRPLGGMNCEDQFNKYGTDKDGNEHILGKTSYWIFQAVEGMQAKFRMLKEKLTSETMVAGFSIPTMVEEFQGNEDQTSDVLKWLAAAIGFGGTLGGNVPVAGPYISGGAGILGGIFSAVADKTAPEDIDTSTISGALVELFDASANQIDATLKLAVGSANSVDDFKALPNPKPNDDWYKSPVAKFFSTGWFLLNEDSIAVDDAIKSITESIKPKIANNVMKAANLRLIADKRVHNREDCGYATGRQWMALRDGEDYCFYIMRYKPFGGNWGESWDEAEEDVYANMAKYNLGNRDSYYRAILDCALSADKQLVVDDLGFNGIPVCFFDLEAFFIDHNDSPECNSNQINKICPPVKATPIA